MIEERCENCRFYSELRINKRYVKEIGKNGVVSGWNVGIKRSKFEDKHCCLMFVKTENEPYVLEVTPNDRCEMFRVKTELNPS